MKDPVVDLEGNTYEKEAIDRWLRVQGSSPVTNQLLSKDQLKPNRELRSRIRKMTGTPRSKSQPRNGGQKPTESRSQSPTLNTLRTLVDSYLRDISTKSKKLSVSLDGMGICAFSFRHITFVIEVPTNDNASTNSAASNSGGFQVYSSFDASSTPAIEQKIIAWNAWLDGVGRSSSVAYVRAGSKSVFTLRGHPKEVEDCATFQTTLENFVLMTLKLHNLIHPASMAKNTENVKLTRSPVVVPVV